MATFDSLPSEVLLIIINYLDRVQDLAALSSQCRRLNQIVDMTIPRRYHRIRTNSEEAIIHAYSLLMEILKTPKLGCFVNQLEVHHALVSTDIQRDRNNHEHERLLSAALAEIGFTDSIERESLKGRTLTTLLVSVCPNIRLLSFAKLTGYLLEDIMLGLHYY